MLLFVGAGAHAETRHTSPCIDGLAEGYPCNKVDLIGHLDLIALGTTAGGNGNDMWGWTDPDTGKEYALIGLNNGTAFVDISDPDHLLRLGNLPTHSVNSTWRDLKTYGYYVFVVSEAQDHGMQIFDLRRLRDVVSPPVQFTEDAWYGNFGRAHDIVINEESGFAYAVGSRQGSQQCSAGLHMINIQNPLVPTFAGCFSADGYTHDAQCITYDGPDTEHAGREICFAANEDTVTIVDVENKSSPVMLSRTGYDGSSYTHQGWLTDDRRYLLVNDELDEQDFGHNTRTYVWDVQDLDAPVLAFAYTGPVAAIDHNLYVHEGYAYESNYRSGLRIVDLSDIDNDLLTEAAFFDTYPASDDANYGGTWSNYPYYASGLVGISDMNRGLFIVAPDLCAAPDAASGVLATANGDNRIDLDWNASATSGASYSVDRILGGCGGSASETIASGLLAPGFSDTNASGSVTYGYRVRAVAESGQCSAAPTTCVEASTSGTCTAPPAFSGIASVESAAMAACAIDLAWQSAQSYCGSMASYEVFRSEDSSFVPSPADRIASAIPGLAWTDSMVDQGTAYTYVVRALDIGNGSVDSNGVRLTAHAAGPLSDGDFFSGAELGTPILSGNVDLAGIQNISAPAHVAWEVVDDEAHSGARSYHSGYNDSECLSIGTDTIQLTSGAAPVLEFWTRYGIEANYDGGLVQISIDDGQSWQLLTPLGGYPSTISQTGNACGFPLGTGAFTGTSLNWAQKQFDLGSFAGQAVKLRWSFGTDGGVGGEGWWLDDIRVTHTQMPGMCTSGSDILFVDGFDPL
ncbi:MAG: choice-of-anchor B family protein [Dokdonella sp.]